MALNVGVLDERKTKRATAVLVTGELGCSRVSAASLQKKKKKGFLTNGSLGVFGSVELDDAGATGTAIGLVLDLRTLDLADGGEEFDEIFVAGGPGKL